MKIKKKIDQIVCSMFLMLPYFMNMVYADEPKFNEGEAKDLAQSWTDPLSSFLLWLIPIVGIVVIAASGLMWLMKPEEERNQKSFTPQAVKMLKIIIALELLPAIWKILSLAS